MHYVSTAERQPIKLGSKYISKSNLSVMIRAEEHLCESNLYKGLRKVKAPRRKS